VRFSAASHRAARLQFSDFKETFASSRRYFSTE
jgi:hypothetical protein